MRLAAQGVEWEVADLVNDEKRDALQAGELVVWAALALGVGQERDPFGRGPKRDAVAGHAGADRDGDREVRLAGAGRAEQDDVRRTRFTGHLVGERGDHAMAA